jgi:hypothetical protein
MESSAGFTPLRTWFSLDTAKMSGIKRSWYCRSFAKPGTHYPHVTFYVLFSTPSLFLPMRWLSNADVYNLVSWCHVKRSVGAILNKHLFHFWKQLVTMSEEHSTRTSRLTNYNRNLRGVLAREPTRAPRQIT